MNRRKEEGFILITVLLLLVLLSVTAFTLNVRSGLSGRMTFNETQAMQIYLGQVSAAEDAFFRIGASPCFRTAGQGFTYQGTAYTRSVADSSLAGCPGCVTVSVTAPGGAKPLRSTVRYYMDTPPPFILKKPYRAVVDGTGNAYFADADNHSIWKVDGAGDVTRVAGTGTSGFAGDGAPASSAQFDSPQGLCIDASGNIYVADTQNHRIRKISMATGMVTTVAGTGPAGSGGDGGPAASAQLNDPENVTVDGQGNLFIADTGNNEIRMVAASTGVITTVAGTGQPGYNGDNVTATSARLSQPSDVAVDALGNLYIADTGNHIVRKVDTTGFIRLIAGTPQSPGWWGDGGPATSARLNQPNGIALDQAGNLLIADTNNNRIRAVNLSSGSISAFAGTGFAGYVDGLAVWARFDSPQGVFVATTGQVYVADTMNCTLRTVANGWVSTLAVTPGPGLSGPSKVAAYYDATAAKVYLYIADAKNNRIRRLDTSTNGLVTVAGTGTAGYWGDGGPATAAGLNGPSGVAVDGSGNIYVADTQNCVIRRIDAATGLIGLVAGRPQVCDFADGQAASARFDHPSAVFKTAGGDIYVADTDNHAVRKLRDGGYVSTVAGTGTPGYSGDGGPASSAKLRSPAGVYADGPGNVYIADTKNGRVRMIDGESGIISTVAGADGFGQPADVYADAAGLVVADSARNGVYFVTGGTARLMAGSPPTPGFNGDNIPAAGGEMNGPSGIAVAGNRGAGRIYVGDAGNNRVRVLSLRMVKEAY